MHVFLKPTSWVYSISWVTSTTVAELPYYKVVRFFYGVKEVKGRHYVLLPLAAVICHSNFFNTLPLRGGIGESACGKVSFSLHGVPSF